MAAVSDSFCFWTNKGGVGKSTLCFHAATAFAQTNPDKQVIVVDCDPQANLSVTMLTQLEIRWNDEFNIDGAEGTVRVREKERTLLDDKFPQTLLGFFIAQYTERKELDPNELLIDAHALNCNIPSNMKLLCGDKRASCITSEIVKGRGLEMPPWVKQRLLLKQFLDRAAVLSGKDTVVFIDTSPFMSALTEVAILSSTKLVVPVLADDYSTDALRNMVYLLHGVGRSPLPSVALYEADMFWANARFYNNDLINAGLRVPKIQTVVFNGCMQSHSAVQQARQSAFDKQCKAIWDIVQEIRAIPDVDVKDVFNFGSTDVPTDPDGGAAVVGKLLGSHMTDLFSAGIICMRCGLPLWTLRRNQVAVATEMDMTRRSGASKSQETSLRQIIGGLTEGIEVGLRDHDDEQRTGVLHSMLRGRTDRTAENSKRRIVAVLGEEQKDAAAAYGPRKRQRAQ